MEAINPAFQPDAPDDLCTVLAARTTETYVKGYCPDEACAWRWSTRPITAYSASAPLYLECGRCGSPLKHYSLTNSPAWR